MPFDKRTIVPGSEKKPMPGSKPIGVVQPDEMVRVTVVLRRKAPVVPAGNGTSNQLSHAQHAEVYGANPEDIALVEQFAHEYQLTVVDSSIQKRRVVLAGPADAMTKAFGTELTCYKIDTTGPTFRGRTGAITVPDELQGVVVAVLGLDNRPAAKPHFRKKKKAAATTFTPPQVAALYNYPKSVNGNGQTIAIIELGGGYSTTDLGKYFSGLGITAPTVTAVSVDGGTNSPGSDADGEVMLDIEVAGAIAPGANIAVYFAPNTDQGFIDAITDAVHDTTRKPSVVSISWGGPEDSWTQQSQTAMNAALQDAANLGVTVTAAAGDDGSTDGAGDGKLHVDFPASSPYALACGGTTLVGSGNKISSEVVWNEIAKQEGATGGGVSNVFPLPSYQSSQNVPQQPETKFAGRGVPDVAGNADPSTGYQVLVDGQSQIVGGTSAVAPLWAALVALMNEQLGTPVGFLNPKIYPLGETVFRDITSGNNDDSKLGYYSAKSGWDPCTGLGSPNGQALLQSLSSSGSSQTQRAPLPGSAPKHGAHTSWSDIAVAAEHPVVATLVLRYAPSSEGAAVGERLLSGELPSGTRQTPAASTHADPNDMAAIGNFASQHGLKIVEQDAASRTIKLEGSAQQMSEAFGVKLHWGRNADGQQFVSYRGLLSVPTSLAGVITAVLGLDQRPAARHRVAML